MADSIMEVIAEPRLIILADSEQENESKAPLMERAASAGSPLNQKHVSTVFLNMNDPTTPHLLYPKTGLISGSTAEHRVFLAPHHQIGRRYCCGAVTLVLCDSLSRPTMFQSSQHAMLGPDEQQEDGRILQQSECIYRRAIEN